MRHVQVIRGRIPRGEDLLHEPLLNKGTAFTEAEREVLGLRGLLPPRVSSQDQQVARVIENLSNKNSPLEKYIYLIGLEDRNETLFYRVVIDHIDELMPIIYTPTVGRACQTYGHIFRRSRGLFISAQDRGRVADVVRNWPHPQVRVIVVTDGERILGLGDLGADGMGIPVGKLSLYTACAGIDPSLTLPVTLDVGTNNQELLNDPLYIGLSQPRLRGEAYLELVDEFVETIQQLHPSALIQLEDFATANAFALLARYRDRVRTFDDDIQGTAAVALAGLYSALRIRGGAVEDQTVLFAGAGEAGIGIGDLVVAAMKDHGLSEAAARARCWFMDSQGAVVKSRTDLAAHKKAYAHDAEPCVDLHEMVRRVRPTVLIGVSGQPGTFTPAILETMAKLNERPIVFALSNPTSKSECTAEQAYAGTEGRAIFASGSPFDPVSFGGKTFVPGQGNNAYIFPGVGLGVITSGARFVTDEMFFAAARVLAELVSEDDLVQGRIYPALSSIRDVSAHIAMAVANIAYRRGLATEPEPEDLERSIRDGMYLPEYLSYV
jgi:malate dehydrogenase (oxaloacetate-decarboxylating)(NADP+)